jgi:hypothetical protein
MNTTELYKILLLAFLLGSLASFVSELIRRYGSVCRTPRMGDQFVARQLSVNHSKILNEVVLAEFIVIF